jgi:phosphatase NudJ
MTRAPIPTWTFVLVVVRLGRRFLIVQERKHDRLWYLPAGRVELGEDLFDAACREALEETGVPVVPEGVLRLQYTPSPDGTVRTRVIFVARPASDAEPKSLPDSHTLKARWVTLEELDDYELRSDEVRRIFTYVMSGGAIYPIDIIGVEGQPW